MRTRAAKPLAEADRAWLERVSKAAFANPFSEHRDALDAEIASTSLDDARVIEKMCARIEARLSAIAQKTGDAHVAVDRFVAEDAPLVEDALLFLAFYRHRDAMDRHLGRDRQRASFAPRVIAELTEHGISSARAKRAVEILYQMYRAHTFIARGLVGASPSTRRLRESLWNSVFTRDVRRYERHLWNRMEDFSTLLLGETGTGKGQAAAAIARSGFIPYDEVNERFEHEPDDAFTSLALGEFPESLIESSLFGHRKGAFTGATEHRDGAFGRCRPHGSVFLDEIGDVPVHVQSKLLRVLQERTFVPLGGVDVNRFEGRIIAATSRPMDELIAGDAFRVDLYYRLAANVIELPTLRARIAEDKTELTRLVAHLCGRITRDEDPALARDVHATIIARLGKGYAFPGNVRELEQCVRRVLLTGETGRAPVLTRREDPFVQQLESGTLTAEALLDAYCARLFAKHQSYVEVARITGLDRRTVKVRADRGAPGRTGGT